MDNNKWGFSLPSLENETDNPENNSNSITKDKTPEKTFNPETGMFEYADRNMQKLHEARQKLRRENPDYLEVKQKEMSNGLEEIGLSRKDLGKTGNSLTGEVTERHKEVANSQTEDAKDMMLRRMQAKVR